MVIAQEPVRSNEHLNAACKIYIPFINYVVSVVESVQMQPCNNAVNILYAIIIPQIIVYKLQINYKNI